jgi:protein-ribulosamine 3-kinase
MIPAQLKSAIEQKLSQLYNSPITIARENSIGGGCINSSYRIETNKGNFFLKWNDADAYPDMFESEAKGLKLLQNTNAVSVPKVIALGKSDKTSFIILELIKSGKRVNAFWQDFGQRLAALHRHSRSSFGLDHNNYIGSLPQCNQQHSSWTDFFIHERLEKQIEMAHDIGAINNSTIQQFNNLYKRLEDLIPKEASSLLHGDLWNGNYMVANDGCACLIDPAVYYGHREMDLAMTRLFGGLEEEFYEAYNDTFPIQPGFESRIDIHNLYPLMVHVNLFGGPYLEQVKSILSRF